MFFFHPASRTPKHRLTLVSLFFNWSVKKFTDASFFTDIPASLKTPAS
jgi:hypothetical protein